MLNDKTIKIDKVNKTEALRYLGYGNKTPDLNIKRLVDECEKKLLEVARPDYIFKVFDIDEYYNIKGCDFILDGQDIKNHLVGCDKIVLMCATLSMEVDKLIRVEQIRGMSEATIIDALGSAMIEQVCDYAEEQIRKIFPENSILTWRYGLGYGDFPLEGQKQFLNVLEAQKKIGVCATPSSMLTPTKSVTCIIGVGQSEVKNSGSKTCGNCSFRDRCQFRNKGESCGN